MSNADYAGDVGPAEAWQILADDPDARLIDVRTDAEWRYVGLPDLSRLGRQTLCVSWLAFPDLRRNEDFVAEVARSGVSPEQTLLLICRSGQRSKDAAIALTAQGYRRCYNVAEGFEGPRDPAGHRGTSGGWKVRDLPWTQE